MSEVVSFYFFLKRDVRVCSFFLFDCFVIFLFLNFCMDFSKLCLVDIMVGFIFVVGILML